VLSSVDDDVSDFIADDDSDMDGAGLASLQDFYMQMMIQNRISALFFKPESDAVSDRDYAALRNVAAAFQQKTGLYLHVPLRRDRISHLGTFQFLRIKIYEDFVGWFGSCHFLLMVATFLYFIWWLFRYIYSWFV